LHTGGGDKYCVANEFEHRLRPCCRFVQGTASGWKSFDNTRKREPPRLAVMSEPHSIFSAYDVGRIESNTEVIFTRNRLGSLVLAFEDGHERSVRLVLPKKGDDWR
jgi:hypothetical protein